MKKIFTTIIASCMLFTMMAPAALANEVPENAAAENTEVNSTNNIPENIAGEDDDYYYVLDEPPVQSRTWSQPQSWSISKGNRTYLGQVKVSNTVTFSISAVVNGVTIKIGTSRSETGKFNKYRQNARITVTYKVYRKVDNKYVRTQTATANTSYIDYVATR